MEENNDNLEKEQFSLKNISEDKLLNQATLRDLILFKEDILKEVRQFASKMKTSLSEKFNKFVEEANEKLPVSSSDRGGLYMKTIKFIEEKNSILSTVSEKEANLNEKIMVNDLHITNCQKEINDAIFKYDRAILDNLLIPGLVGQGCKFSNFKDYMVDIQEQINNAVSKLDFNGENINQNKKSLEEQLNNANTKIKNLEYESKQFTFEKTLALENKLKQDMETVHKNMLELTGEYYKNNVELKNQIESLKNTEKLIKEENRKINYHTLKEFDIIQKGFKYMKKTIIDLGKLLMLSDKRTKANKNLAANKQLIIEQFNNMMLDLVKDVKKEKQIPPPKEAINPKPSTKKAVSVIKQYIEGKIQADDTNFLEKERKERKKNSANKDKENEEFFKGSPIKRPSNIIMNKQDELNSSRSNNNKVGTSFEKYKKFSRHPTVEIKDIKGINKINTMGSNSEIESKKNNNILGETNKSHQFAIIKEEKNNMSKSNDESLFSDLEEDFKNLKLHDEQSNIFNYKGKENRKFYDEENSLFHYENNANKFNKKKTFFRAATTSYNIIKGKKIENANQNNESFKLLLKAQENLKKKNMEKAQQLTKKESDSSQFLEKKTSSKKVNFINQDKLIEKKKSYINGNLTPKVTSSFDNQEYQNKDNKSNDISGNINYQNTENNTNKNYNPVKSNRTLEIKEQNKENKMKLTKENQKINNIEINAEEKINMEIKEVKKEEEDKKVLEKINDIPKEKVLLNYKLKENLDNNALMQNNNKSKIKNNNNTNNNLTKTQYGDKFMPPISKSKNLSPINNKLKLVKIEKNKEDTKREVTFSANIKNKHHNIITKFPTTQSTESKSSIPNLKAIKIQENNLKESQIKYNNQLRTLRNYNFLNEDIFVNKEDIKKMNYYKDQDIIDKPLIVNQVNIDIQKSKGTIENKLIELEYFTKKKFDELVREIKNFIPIHFNAYIKE